MALHHHIAKHKKTIYRVFVVLVVFFVGWGVVSFVQADINAKARYSLIEKEIEEVVPKINSLEAVERTHLATGAGKDALGMFRCVPSQHCPFVSKQWFVAIEPGKELEFLKDLIKEGYTIDADFPGRFCEHLNDECFLSTSKGEVEMSFHLGVAGQEIWPKETTAPKRWYQLGIKFSYK